MKLAIETVQVQITQTQPATLSIQYTPKFLRSIQFNEIKVRKHPQIGTLKENFSPQDLNIDYALTKGS